MTRRWHGWKVLTAVAATVVSFSIAYYVQSAQFTEILTLRGGRNYDDFPEEPGIVPSYLLGRVYNASDFRNERGIVPPFWSCSRGACNSSEVWGPCYAPRGAVDWGKQIAKDQGKQEGPVFHHEPGRGETRDDLADYCRPGFIIIGAGKCGTSSLYHYLTSHPKVLPAKEKQIHYFKYYKDYPMKWYYEHFATATSFLASGALMTGEASPGYLPYPDVARLVKRRLPGPRIIAVGRNPIERSYSSYRYNYVTPTIELMKKGKFPDIIPGQPDDYYMDYLFSFEDLVRAELQRLRKCLAPNGSAVQEAKDYWIQKDWAQAIYDQRSQAELPPLVDLDGFCYGDVVNATVIREQWSELVARSPQKVLSIRNVHLKQSIVGRSLYVLPLEWWYAQYSAKSIHFLCTEELSDLSGEPLAELSDFLGLPSFNFTDVVKGGAFNVGGHRGYDKEVPWEKIQEEHNVTQGATVSDISDELRQELLDFFRPYNERLFQLVGKRCNW